MKMWPDCVPCILRMALEVARTAARDEDKLKGLFHEIMELPWLKVPASSVYSPLAIRDVYRLITAHTGIEDPLREIKQRQNEEALALLVPARAFIAESRDPVRDALRFAIAGNAIDIIAHGIDKRSGNLVGLAEGKTMSERDAGVFFVRLSRSRKIVYIGDNCGEIVFDGLFIETLRSRYDVDITFVVRKVPVLNDATLNDALTAGIDRLARVLDNGIDDPVPGTLLSRVSREVRDAVREADLIISKGGGNYDVLTDEASLRQRTTFLVEAKCFPYCSLHGVTPGTLIVHNA